MFIPLNVLYVTTPSNRGQCRLEMFPPPFSRLTRKVPRHCDDSVYFSATEATAVLSGNMPVTLSTLITVLLFTYKQGGSKGKRWSNTPVMRISKSQLRGRNCWHLNLGFAKRGLVEDFVLFFIYLCIFC